MFYRLNGFSKFERHQRQINFSSELVALENDQEEEESEFYLDEEEEIDKLYSNKFSTQVDTFIGRKIHQRDHLPLNLPIGSLSCENVKNYTNENDIRLLQYFCRLPWKSSFAFEYVDGLRKIANINVTDDYGQSLLHEIARDWKVDVAKFLQSRGIKLDIVDNFGRTPLMVAAASNNSEMVEWLIKQGAQKDMKSEGPAQFQAIHFAAAYDAPSSLKVLIDSGVHPDQPDALNETPLFLAAKYGANRTCKILLDMELPVGTYTVYGITPLDMMVDKMKTEFALKALDQCVITDKQSASEKFYLSIFSAKRWRVLFEVKGIPRERNICGNAIEIIAGKFDKVLIEHPVIQQYIKEMSEVYGDFYIVVNIIANFSFTFFWTMSSSLHNLSQFYKQQNVRILKGLSMSLAFILTVAFTVKLYLEYKAESYRAVTFNKVATSAFIQRKNSSHPRWDKDEIFNTKEEEQIQSNHSLKFMDGWDWLELITLLYCYVHFVLNMLWLALPDNIVIAYIEKGQIYSSVFFLILIWMRLNRCLLFSQSIGPYITILVYSTTAVVQFAFLFCEFFIPFTCVFWVFFGGNRKKLVTGEYMKFNDVIYQLYLITIVGDYAADDLWKINNYVAEVCLAIYFILVSIICMNIYIALLTEVFTTNISSAMATSSLYKTKNMLMFEWMSNKISVQMQNHLYKNCSPLTKPLRSKKKAEKLSLQDVMTNIGLESRKLIEDLAIIAENEKEFQKDMESVFKKVEEFKKTFSTERKEEIKECVEKMKFYSTSKWFDASSKSKRVSRLITAANSQFK